MGFGNMYCAGITPALNHTRRFLSDEGVIFTDSPDWNTRHLLLDVPAFRPGSWTKETMDTMLSSLPNDIVVWGGNLNHTVFESYKTIDLLQDELYLQENAKITADCTIPIAKSVLKQPWPACRVLIIGWGRIGKSLSLKLKDLGCDVTVFSRSSCHSEEAVSLGFRIATSLDHTHSFHLVVNTAPTHILSAQNDISSVYIDLASVRGISGDDVIWAKGLPGKFAPERSGKLIADTILRLSKEVLS